MIGALIILASVVMVGVVLYINHRLSFNNDCPLDNPDSATQNNECCGMHITCEKDSLLSINDKIIYYDDEELDQYIGRDADSYTNDEIEQFRDVLLTLLPNDIAGWGRSIQLRGITLPTPVRDELLMIVSEARQNPQHN